MGESGLRNVGRLVVPATGAVVEAPGDRVLPVRLAGCSHGRPGGLSGGQRAVIAAVAVVRTASSSGPRKTWSQRASG
jgi:hypothetical protein